MFQREILIEMVEYIDAVAIQLDTGHGHKPKALDLCCGNFSHQNIRTDGDHFFLHGFSPLLSFD